MLRMSDAEMDLMAEQNPCKLAKLLTGGSLSPYEVTFGAEYLGRHCHNTPYASLALDTLGHLLFQDHSTVREGAIYGLCYLKHPVGVQILQERLKTETNDILIPILQDAIADLLSGQDVPDP